MEKNFSANRIRELREDRDLRQKDVAAATGIDQRSLSNYETGKTVPDGYVIVKLAQFFGVTCDYLLGVTERNLKNARAVIDEIDEICRRLDDVVRYLNKS